MVILDSNSAYLPELLILMREIPKKDKLINSSLIINRLLKEGFRHIIDIRLYPALLPLEARKTDLTNAIYQHELEILINKEIMNEYFSKEFFYPRHVKKTSYNRHYIIEEFIEPLKKNGTICYMGIRPHDKTEYYDEVLKIKRKGKILHFGVWY